jgi:hypothetical protein
MTKASMRPGTGKRSGAGMRAMERDTGPRTDGDGGKLGARRPGSMAPRQRGDRGGQRKRR